VIKPLVLPGLRRREQLAANQIDAIQSSTLRIEPEDRDSKLVGPHPCSGTHATTSEDQRSTPVSSDNRSRVLNLVDLQVSRLVLDPAKIARPIQVADLARFTRCTTASAAPR